MSLENNPRYHFVVPESIIMFTIPDRYGRSGIITQNKKRK